MHVKQRQFGCAVILVLLATGFLWADEGDMPMQRAADGGIPHDGPYVHEVWSARSSDGLVWTIDGQALLQHASVPMAILQDPNNILIYYVDASKPGPENTNVARSTDGGKTFAPLGLSISGMTKRKAVDPCAVHLPDGRIRLYYYGCDASPDAPGEHEIHSAISSDGVHFREEGKVFPYSGLVDPDVFWNGAQWVMLVFSLSDHDTIVATSPDGTHFSYKAPLGIGRYGTVAPVRLKDGRFRMYAFGQEGQAAFVSFISRDGLNWKAENGTRLTAPQGKEITDPQALQLPDGSWKMFFKVSPHTLKKGSHMQMKAPM